MTNKHFHTALITSLLVLVPLSAAGSNYVPPPTGPYQSSVIINSSDQFSVEQPQVYKFPPADLVDEVYATEPDLTQPTIDYSGQYPQGNELANQPSYAPVPSTYYDEPVMNDPAAAENTQFSGAPPSSGYAPYANPWGAANANTIQPPYQSGYQADVWSYPQGGYSNQYPYMNRYDRGDNSNYYGMPGPWSMMPNNPFFSGQ